MKNFLRDIQKRFVYSSSISSFPRIIKWESNQKKSRIQSAVLGYRNGRLAVDLFQLEGVSLAPSQILRMPMDFSWWLNMSGKEGQIRQDKENKVQRWCRSWWRCYYCMIKSSEKTGIWIMGVIPVELILKICLSDGAERERAEKRRLSSRHSLLRGQCFQTWVLYYAGIVRATGQEMTAIEVIGQYEEN